MIGGAVERQFTVMGEALNKLSKVDSRTADTITELSRIVGFRNVLVHGYATVGEATSEFSRSVTRSTPATSRGQHG